MTRVRADVALVERGHFATRQQARAAILEGRVRVAGRVLTKAGHELAADTDVVVEEAQEFVSRGGRKLAGALDGFGLAADGRRALDVGASTGGFTDCLLQRGARAVTALDVGYGQLAWPLRSDERVTVVERTNIRDVRPGDLGAAFELAVVDVSFIGLDKVLPVVFGLLEEDGDVLALVKPQFEAGREVVGRGGVVRDPASHAAAIRSVAATAEAAGWRVRGMTWSPLRGPKGNIEFWVWLARQGDATVADPDDIVREAHEALGA